MKNMEIRIIDVCIFISFLFFIYKNIIKNNKYQKKIDDLTNEIDDLKLHLKKLEKTNNLYIEKINILDNENTKIKSNITEIKNDVEIKNKLFLNSIKFLKFDLENILIKHNKYIQYIYYYFGNKKEDNEYFKFFIATNKLYDYFYDVNNINEHFFSKSFKEFIHKINLKN